MREGSRIAGIVTSTCIVGVSLLLASEVSAAPPKVRRNDDRPFGAGALVPSFGFGASINSRVSQVAFGGGARYFALPGFGVGLSFSNAFTIYGDGFASAYPGIRSRSPTWEGDLMPSLLVVPYRSRWFSPYVLGGVGPRFVNNGKPTLAVWQAGAGAFIGLGGPVFLDLGVGFQQAFPRDRCDRAYTFETTETPASLVTLGGACLVTISPRIGLAIGLGVGRGERKRSRGAKGRGTAPAVQGSSTFEPPTATPPNDAPHETPPAPAPSPYDDPILDASSPPVGEGESPNEPTPAVDAESDPAGGAATPAEPVAPPDRTDETPPPDAAADPE